MEASGRQCAEKTRAHAGLSRCLCLEDAVGGVHMGQTCSFSVSASAFQVWRALRTCRGGYAKNGAEVVGFRKVFEPPHLLSLCQQPLHRLHIHLTPPNSISRPPSRLFLSHTASCSGGTHRADESRPHARVWAALTSTSSPSALRYGGNLEE
eukprot:3656919-Rhodomonas_salina.1